jgi:hypothetical protein
LPEDTTTVIPRCQSTRSAWFSGSIWYGVVLPDDIERFRTRTP